jgi:serine/threonine protein kinase
MSGHDPASTELVPGAIFDGAYQIMSPLGAGGMASVYLVRHLALDKILALKVLRDTGTDPVLLSRFQNEARTIARLQHPNIVQVYNFGVENGRLPYLVMEVLDGQSLAQYLEKYASMPILRAMDIVSQVADALYLAHQKGIVHRDMKPANLMLVSPPVGVKSQDFVKVLDFGIAKDQRQSLTAAGQIVGSPYYMSPEQFVGQPVTLKSDIYSLGVTFYQIVTGELPYCGRTFAETAQMHISDPVPTFTELTLMADSPLAQLSSQQLDLIDQVLEGMMAKDPQHRYGSMRELSVALSELRADLTGRPVASLTMRSTRPYGNIEQSDLDQSQEISAIQIAGWWDRLSKRARIAICATVATSLLGLAAGALALTFYKPAKKVESSLAKPDLSVGPVTLTDAAAKIIKSSGDDIGFLKLVSKKNVERKIPLEEIVNKKVGYDFGAETGKVAWSVLVPKAGFLRDPRSATVLGPQVTVSGLDLKSLTQDLREQNASNPQDIANIFQNALAIARAHKELRLLDLELFPFMPKNLVHDYMQLGQIEQLMVHNADKELSGDLRSDHWGLLTTLTMFNGKDFAGYIAPLATSTKLKGINLSQMQIDDEVMHALAKRKKIVRLIFTDCTYPVAGKPHVASQLHVRHTEFNGTNISGDFLRKLRPYLQMEWITLKHNPKDNKTEFFEVASDTAVMGENDKLTKDIFAAIDENPQITLVLLQDYQVDKNALDAIYSLRKPRMVFFYGSTADPQLLKMYARKNPHVYIQMDKLAQHRIRSAYGFGSLGPNATLPRNIILAPR